MKVVNAARVVEVVGRLQARGAAFLHAAKQTNNEHKKLAFTKAGREMCDLCTLLAGAFDSPSEVLTPEAYRNAMAKQKPALGEKENK